MKVLRYSIFLKSEVRCVKPCLLCQSFSTQITALFKTYFSYLQRPVLIGDIETKERQGTFKIV